MDIERINDKEKEILASLVSPDKAKEHHYDWPLEAQQQLLGCLISDKGFLDQCFSIVKPYYFADKAHSSICKILYEHYEKFQQMPSKLVIELELAERLENSPSFAYYLAELDIVCDYVYQNVISKDFFLKKAIEFAKTQALRLAFTKVIDILSKRQEDKWQLVEETIKDALSIQPSVDLGMNYFEQLEERYQRMLKQQEQQDFFTTGFPSIDVALGGGLSRGEIGAFGALSGGGKSLCMASAAADNLSKGRKVLYVSLEMDEDKTSCRFDSMFSSVPMQMLLHNHEKVITRLKDFSNSLAQQYKTKNCFYIKQFPAGTADMTTIRGYMAQLSLQKGFSPDLVIVDYVGEMRDDPNIKTYESRQRLVRDLRGLAVEHKICALTGLQISRGGREAMKTGYIDDSFVADSQGQVRPLDALWSINQEDAEISCGVGRIFVVKHRNGKSRFVVYFKRDEKTLKTTEISADMYKKIMSEYTKIAVENNEMPNFNVETKFKPNKPSESE